MYSHVSEDDITISVTVLVVLSVTVPLISIVLGNALQYGFLSSDRWLWDMFSGALAFVGSEVVQLAITAILKNLCGLPRPDMIDRCQPPYSMALIPSFQLANVTVCDGGNFELIKEGFRSFPSAHLSTIFSSLVFSFLFLAGKLQSFDCRGISFKLLLPIVPMILALIVSCSRVSDNRHFLQDIIAGAIIGASTSTWFYFMYFPSVFDLSNCGRSYPPRRFGCTFDNVGGFWSISDVLPGSYSERTEQIMS